MTFRPPIIITIYPRPKAQAEYVVSLNVLYSPNPAQPFNLSDWPNTSRGRPTQDSAGAANLLPLNTPVVVASLFNQSLWESAALRRRPAIVDTVEVLLPVYSPFSPFTNQTEPVAFRRQPLKSDIYVNLLPLQSTAPSSPPFYQSDWNGIAPRRRAAKVDDEVLLLAQFFPNPRAPFVVPSADAIYAARLREAKVDEVANLLPLSVTPPPVLTVNEWIIRARRRGRR